jgi:alpha-L-arabinofuranosidase
MTVTTRSLALILLMVGPVISEPKAAKHYSVTVSIQPQAANAVSPLLFGQFLERAGKGEPGPDAALAPDHRRLRPEVVALLKQMRIPIMRYPGGGYLPAMGPWTDYIDHYPTPQDSRRQPDAFGYHEYLELAEELGAQSVLPVEFRMALWKERPLAEAAALAAGLVAYCNAPAGATLPSGMPDWPAIRAANGHPAPFNVRWFQIGNEWFAYFDAMAKVIGLTDQDQQIAWTKTCLHAYIDAMKAIDPTIKVIIEGTYWEPHQARVVEALLADSSLRAKSGYACYHLYKPWNSRVAKRSGNVVPWDSLAPEQKWYACVATPMFDESGQAVLRPDTLEGNRHRGRVLLWAKQYGWRIAMTEWNWNGGSADPVVKHLWTKAVGAAGFLNAIVRAGGAIDLATQSMLVGTGWAISAVHVPIKGSLGPHPHPSGLATALYARYHGDRRLGVTLEGVPTYSQPLQIGEIMPQPVVAMADVVATADSATVFLHVVNRHYDAACRLDVCCAGLVAGATARVHTLAGPLSLLSTDSSCTGGARLVESQVACRKNRLEVELPPRSVSVVEMPRSRPAD